MELKILLVLHVFGATIWAGGLLILCFGVLPGAWRKNNPDYLATYMKPFERVGHPALLVQILTGLRLATLQIPISSWFTLQSHSSRLITLKLILLVFTVLLISLDKMVIQKQIGRKKMNLLGMNTIALTVVSVLLVLAGLSFRFGILI